MDRAGPGADWRDAAAYAPLLDAERSAFAWEWVRRDPDYRDAAERAVRTGALSDGAERWGLHVFEDPVAAVPAARPIWRAEANRAVLRASAHGRGSEEDAFDLARHASLATLVTVEAEERVLFSDGLRFVRLDIVTGTVAAGPVEFRYSVSGIASAKAPLLTLRQLLALLERGQFSRALHPREPRARRWILLLRAHDALAHGASQREIAARLLDQAAAGERWRVHAPSLRSQVQRLVRSAKALASGGYRVFLQ